MKKPNKAILAKLDTIAGKIETLQHKMDNASHKADLEKAKRLIMEVMQNYE